MTQLRRDPLPLPTPGLITRAANQLRQKGQTAPLQISASPTAPLSAPDSVPTALSASATGPLMAPVLTGSASAQLGLFDPPAKAPSAQSVKALETMIGQRLSLKGNTLPAPLRQQLQQSLDQLKQKLAFYDLSQPTVRQEVHGLLKQLAQQLSMANLMEPPIKAGLDQLSASVIAESGASLGLQVERRGNLPGLKLAQTAQPGQETLLSESQELLRDLERAKHSPKKIDAQTLLLFSLRDELLRRNLEILAPKGPETPLFVNHPEEDLGIIKGAVETVDGLLASTRDLPPDMLNDLSRLTDAISKADPGQIAENVRKLREQTSANQISDLGQQLKDLASQDQLDLPGLQKTLADLNRSASSLDATSAAQIQDLTQQLSESLQKGSSQAAGQLNTQMQAAAKQLTEIAKQGQQISLPQPITQLVDLAFQGVQAGPPNIGGGLSNVVDLYSRGMSGVQSKLPPLWFPVTMPVPLVYNKGGDSFVLPAGSRLSQDRRTGAYNIQAPGFYMQTGSTQVAANQASIQLGNGLDRLQMASLAVNEPGQQTLLQNVTAQINRNERSSLIQAQQVTVNNDSGQIQLENARMIQTPEAFQLATDRLLYQQGDNTLSGQNIGLWQSEKDGIEDFRGGGENLKFNNGQTLITADRMGFQMSNNENTGEGLLRFAGENVAVQSGDSRIQAAQGSFDLINRADGTSGVILAAENASWQQGSQSVSTQGLSTLKMERDAEGRIREFSAQSQNVNYANGNQLGQLTDGQLAVKYNPDGSLSQVGAQVGHLHWQDPEQGLDASGVGLNMSYGPNGQLQALNGKIESLNYQGQGQSLTASQTQVQALWGENGQLSSVAAQAGQLEWQGANGELLKATDTQLKAQYHPNGQLGSVNASSGQVFLQQAGQTLQLDKAQAGITYRPDGSLQKIQGGAEKLDWQSGSDSLKVEQLQGQLNYGENGLLQNAHLSAGNLSYQGASGLIQTQGQSSLNLNYGPNGQLLMASAQTQALSYQGSQGQLDLTGGKVALNYGPNGQLQNVTGKIDTLKGQIPGQGQLDASQAQVQLKYGENGLLQQAGASVGQLKWQGENGDKLDVQGLGAQLNYGPNGLLQSANAQAGNINYTGSLGQVNTQGQTSLNALYRENGELASLQAHSAQIDVVAQGLTAHAENTTIKLDTHENGLISQISGSTDNLRLQGDWGTLNTTGTTSVGLKYTDAGQLAGVSAHSDQLSLLQNNTRLDLSGAQLDLAYGANGQLSQASASITQGSYAGDFGKIDLAKGANLQLQYGENGQLSQIQAGVEKFQYAGDKGQLDLNGAQLNAKYGSDGLLENIRFTGDSVDFKGTTGQNQPLNFSMGNFAADLTQKADGGQAFNFNGNQIKLDTQGHNLNLPEVRTLNLETGADGSISAMNLHLPGHNTYSNPDLNAALDNLQASYTQEGNELKASFDKLNLAVPKEGLTAEVIGGKLVDNDRLTSLHLDSATVVKNLEQELNVKVENVDLLINKTPTGSMASADLQIGQADALVSGMNLMVRTQNGDRVRLNMQMSDDGTFLREAFLQIPQGGEIKLSKDDLNVSLGGGQKLSFSQDGKGLYTFRGEGLNVNAVTKDAKIQVQGGTAQVSLDSKNGNLIIDEIKGVNVHAEVGGQKIDVNIKEMEGFLVRATGISGLAQGAAIHLVPTSDSSRMTAEIHTTYNGIPIAVKLDNVHELKALATIETNRAHVYFGDPSGRGKVSISAGPLEMKGNAIEFVARYQQYDPQRMMSTLSRALSSDGFEIVKGVQVELDGVVRLQTPFKNGPHAGLTLLFPRPMAMTQQPFDPNPFAASQAGKGLNDGATGIVTELGWKHTNGAGTQSTYGVHAGLVPGSYLSIDQTQGQTTLAGVPLPKNFSLPTTAIAGVTYRRHGDNSRLDVMAGGYVNPAGLAPANVPLSEPNKYGAYAGFNYREGNWQLGVTSTVDLSQRKPNVGGMVSLGFSF